MLHLSDHVWFIILFIVNGCQCGHTKNKRSVKYVRFTNINTAFSLSFSYYLRVFRIRASTDWYRHITYSVVNLSMNDRKRYFRAKKETNFLLPTVTLTTTERTATLGHCLQLSGKTQARTRATGARFYTYLRTEFPIHTKLDWITHSKTKYLLVFVYWINADK